MASNNAQGSSLFPISSATTVHADAPFAQPPCWLTEEEDAAAAAADDGAVRLGPACGFRVVLVLHGLRLLGALQLLYEGRKRILDGIQAPGGLPMPPGPLALAGRGAGASVHQST